MQEVTQLTKRLALITMVLWLPTLIEAQQPVECPQPGPLSEAQLTELVKGPSVPAARKQQLVKSCGIDFDSTGQVLDRLRSAGAPEALLDAVRNAIGPAERKRQAEQAAWESIKDSQDPQVFEQFLREHSASQYAGAAGQKLVALRADAAEYVDRAKMDLGRGDFGTALLDCQKAIELDSMNAMAYNYCGVASARMHDERSDESAIKYYAKSIELNDTNAMFLINRAALWMHGTHPNYQFAAADLTRVIELEPTSEHYAQRALAYEWMDDFGQAVADNTKAIELDPRNGMAYNNRAVGFKNLKQLDRALEDYSKCIELQYGDGALNYRQRGSVYAQLKNFQRAIEDFDKAVQLNPKDWEAYRSRGDAKGALGDAAGAKADYERAASLGAPAQPAPLSDSSPKRGPGVIPVEPTPTSVNLTGTWKTAPRAPVTITLIIREDSGDHITGEMKVTGLRKPGLASSFSSKFSGFKKYYLSLSSVGDSAGFGFIEIVEPLTPSSFSLVWHYPTGDDVLFEGLVSRQH